MKKWGPHGPCPKQKTIFSEITKTDSKLSKPFYFNKIPYVLAELCFSILCNAFLLKSAISSHNSCEFVMYLIGKEKIMSGLSDFE